MATKDPPLPPQNSENGEVIAQEDIDIFICAATMGDINSVNTFLAKWPHAIDQKDAHTWTALMHAAFSGHAEIVDMLIKHGADVREKDKWGRSIWVLVRRRGNRKIISLIEEALKKKKH